MWVPITLAAATFQILRTSQQHRLRDTLSTAAATYVRFLYGAPFAVVTAALWTPASAVGRSRAIWAMAS